MSRSVAMLRLVCAVLWSLAIAEDTYLSPSNNTVSKDYNSFTSTISVDPWSPVVGDTEGAPAYPVTQETRRKDNVRGRPAEISLVENIRRQLMRDNYDYVSDASEEISVLKKPSPEESISTTSVSDTSIHSQQYTPRVMQTKSANPATTSAVFSYRETHLQSPLNNAPKLSPIQVASVSMPVKSDRGKQIKTFNYYPQLRSMDKESLGLATIMAKDIRREIEVSKKDLLFYMDDAHFRRKDPHSAFSSISRRRNHDLVDTAGPITTIGRKQVKYDKDNHSAQQSSSNVDLNQITNRLENVTKRNLDNKHKSLESGRQTPPTRKQDSQAYTTYDDKDVEKTKNKNGKGQKQKLLKFDDREKEFKNRTYRNERDEKQNMKEDGKENFQSISEHSNREPKKMGNQLVNEQSSSNDGHEKAVQKLQLEMNKDVSQNKGINREQQRYDDHQNVRAANRENFRRNNYKRSHKRKNKAIEQLDDSQQSNYFYDKDREVQHKINQNSQNIHKKKERNKIKFNKRKLRKTHYKKKAQLSSEDTEKNNEQLYNLRNNEENRENIRKPKRHQLEESVNEKSDQAEKQSESDNSLYTQNTEDIATKDKDIVKRTGFTKTTYRHNTQKEIKKNDYTDSKQSGSTNQNDSNLSNNDDRIHDELKGDHKDDENEQEKVQKSQYIDSMDNEDLTEFNGRRMNTLTNDTQSEKELDRHDSQCNNSQHGCVNPEYKKHNTHNITINVEAVTSPTAKYKLLKVRDARGSRRSNVAERQFLEERGPKGLSLFAIDGAPFPQFRLPRSRRQYMDEHADIRPPLLEQISRKSINRRHSKRRRRKQQKK